jgi:hypothetical protein
MTNVTVNMQRDRRGGWAIQMSDRWTPLTCETFDEARRVAYLCAARRRACEIVVCDESARVVYREFIEGAQRVGTARPEEEE